MQTNRDACSPAAFLSQKTYKEYIMDSQKPNEGSGRDIGREGAGANMGKDTNQGRQGNQGNANPGNSSGNIGNAAKDLSNDANKAAADVKAGAKDLAADAGKAIDNAKDSAKETVNNLTKDLPKNADEVHDTIDKAAGTVQPLVDKIASSAHAGVDKVSGALSGVSGSFNDKTAQLRDAYGNLTATSREYVRTSPGTSIAIAVGAGYILAKLLGSRK
jgi:ElaB/YqjD/DUF883 family membrane-anchored ribosome-binding protein